MMVRILVRRGRRTTAFAACAAPQVLPTGSVAGMA